MDGPFAQRYSGADHLSAHHLAAGHSRRKNSPKFIDVRYVVHLHHLRGWSRVLLEPIANPGETQFIAVRPFARWRAAQFGTGCHGTGANFLVHIGRKESRNRRTHRRLGSGRAAIHPGLPGEIFALFRRRRFGSGLRGRLRERVSGGSGSQCDARFQRIHHGYHGCDSEKQRRYRCRNHRDQ